MGNIELEVPRRRQIFQQTKHNQQVSPQKPSHRTGRVTDFNDFLTEIKKQMNSSPSPKEDQLESSEELVLKFRLENERVELEKYRRMVHRELGKNYSIQSIQIEEGEGEREKTIKIEYQQTPQKGIIAKNGNGNFDLVSEQRQVQKQCLVRGKKIYQEVRGRIEVLEQLMSLYQKKHHQGSLALNGEAQQSNPRLGGGSKGDLGRLELRSQMSKISDLFKNLNEIQSKQTTFQTEIKEVLELKRMDSSEESSGMMAERNV